MKIWLVEDDHQQAQQIVSGLEEAFGPVVQVVKTEFDFTDAIPSIIETEDSVVVMDILLRWSDPAPDSPPAPEEVKDQGPYKAGIRCLEQLAEAGGGKVPSVVYTVLDLAEAEDDLGASIEKVRLEFKRFASLRKEGSTEELVKTIRDLTEATN